MGKTQYGISLAILNDIRAAAMLNSSGEAAQFGAVCTAQLRNIQEISASKARAKNQDKIKKFSIKDLKNYLLLGAIDRFSWQFYGSIAR